MKSTIRNSIIIIGLLLAGCGSNTSKGNAGVTDSSGVTNVAGKTVAALATVAPLPDGAALYAGNCAGCHGALTSSTKIGADTTRIQNSITGNSGGMGYLATLTQTEIQAIATAMSPVPVGAALYKSNCLGCHGGLTTTIKAGADSSRIQNAVTGNIGGMGFLAMLSPLQVQAIAATLAIAPTGTALYASNCAGCHGAIATSVKIAADFSRTLNAINNNTGGMGYLATLTAADIQAITAVLAAP
jgi:mono/diheme cytochrome c family protein